MIAVEDRGDTLHTQHNALDSARLFHVNLDYSNPANTPVRILAQGRDASATIDSGLLGSAGFTNDGDNEITGIHVSDGDSTAGGILGAKIPRPFDGRWRVFYTQQHGDNNTYEIILNRAWRCRSTITSTTGIPTTTDVHEGCGALEPPHPLSVVSRSHSR